VNIFISRPLARSLRRVAQPFPKPCLPDPAANATARHLPVKSGRPADTSP